MAGRRSIHHYRGAHRRRQKANVMRYGFASEAGPPRSVWQGSFSVYGVEIKCHTLEDGQRIIEADSLNSLFDAMADDVADLAGIDEFARWLRGA